MPVKGDLRRARIQSAIAELLETSHFEAISIAEITRRADVTRPGFYFYFPTKGAAVASLMEGLFVEFEEAARIWYEHRGENQRAALRDGMHATVTLWRKHALVMYGMVQAASADAAAREVWDRWVSAFLARAIPTVAADAGAHLRRAGTDPTAVARVLVDATFSAMQRDVRAIVETGTGTPDVVESLTHVWAQALYSTSRG